MSQIVDYGDPYIEMLSIFLRLLEKVIAESSWSAEVDLSDVVLVGVKHTKKIAVDISLTGDGELKGISAARCRAAIGLVIRQVTVRPSGVMIPVLPKIGSAWLRTHVSARRVKHAATAVLCYCTPLRAHAHQFEKVCHQGGAKGV